MCGRKTLTKDIASIIEEMNIQEWEENNYKPSYNVAPTDFSPVVIQERIKVVKMMKWGLIPAWSNNSRNGSKMINARLETLLEKPSFSNLVHQNRCVVLSDGYYEWTKQDNQAYYITHKKNKNVMLVSSYPIRIPFGVMDINSSNIVTKFEEKPLLTQVMNIGFFYVPKIMFDVFSKYKKFEILLGNLAKQKKLKSFKHTGVHITVNTVAELEDAQENAKKLYK